MAQIKPLSSDLQKIAEIELDEVPSRIAEDIEAIRTWIEQQPHLKARKDDQFLVQFLRGCKYSLENAKDKIERLYTLKTKYPELCNATDVNCKRFREIYNLGFMTALPTPLHDNGPRIIVCKVQDDMINDTYDIEEVYQAALAMLELITLNDPYASINGIVMIFDNSNSNYVLKFTPTLAKKTLNFLEKSLPARIKELYYINNSTFFQSVFTLVSPLFSEKLRERIVVCGDNVDELQNHIPAKYLPKDYGGENGSLDQLVIDWEKNWDEHSDYFKENLDYGVDESLRQGPADELFDDCTFGLRGSFRKISIR